MKKRNIKIDYSPDMYNVPVDVKVEKSECEKCGEETSVKLIGDESYDYCSDCNWITH